MADTEIGKKFNQAAAYVQGAMQYSNGLSLSSSDQLDFYGLYKQATCRSRDDFLHLSKPPFWQFAATRKYWAWERYSHISKYEALVQYVKKVKHTFPQWQYDPKVSQSSHAMTKTVSKMSGDDEPDRLDRFLGLVRDNQLEKVREMINASGDVKSTDEDGQTALHWAVDKNHAEMVDLLIQSGADVNAADCEGATPLHLASVTDNVSLVKALLAADADPNLTDVDGSKPIDLAETEEVKTALGQLQ